MKPSRASSLASPTTPSKGTKNWKIPKTCISHLRAPLKSQNGKFKFANGTGQAWQPSASPWLKKRQRHHLPPREKDCIFSSSLSPPPQNRNRESPFPNVKKDCVPRIIRFPCHVVVSSQQHRAMSSKMSLPGVKIVRSPAAARVFKKGRSRGRWRVVQKRVESQVALGQGRSEEGPPVSLLVVECRFDTWLGWESKRTPSAPRDCRSRWRAGARGC